jgi:hypothetical protein
MVTPSLIETPVPAGFVRDVETALRQQIDITVAQAAAQAEPARMKLAAYSA